MNFGKKAVALSVRQIKAGAEINDSYGAVYHHMDKPERQQFLQVSQSLCIPNHVYADCP